jgi:hypothetical protein
MHNEADTEVAIPTFRTSYFMHNAADTEVAILPGSLDSFQIIHNSRIFQPCYSAKQALNDISARHAVGLFSVPGHAGVRGNEIANELARNDSAQRFVGPEPVLGFQGRI